MKTLSIPNVSRYNLFAVMILGIFLCCLPCTSMYGIDTYGRLWAGGARLHDKIKDYEVKYQTGYAAGVAVGCSFWCYCKCEVEGIYLFDKIKDIRLKHKTTGLKGSIRAYSCLANFILEYPLSSFVKPYVGLGGGFSYEKVEIHTKGLAKQKDHEKRFAYQFLGGLSIPLYELVCGNLSLFLEGRYFVFDKHVRAALVNAGLSLNF